MGNKRRHSIRNRINNIVLLITAISLIITSVFGIISMIAIQKEAEDALIEQSMENLQEVISGKTRLADQRLEKYAELTRDLAYYAEEIINNPQDYKPREIVFPVSADNAGKLTIQVAMANEDMKWEDVKDIGELYANVEPRFYPVMKQNENVITTIYFGTTTADVIVCYDVQSDIKAGMQYYNFYETSWYKLCEEKKDLAFTPVYEDGFGRGMTTTCVCPLHDKSGEITGIIGVDILINDLYSEIIDLDLGDNAKIFVAGDNNDIISPNVNEAGEDMTEDHVLAQSDIERAAEYPSGIVARDNSIFAFDTIKSANWKLFVSVPQSNVLEFANRIGQNIISSIIIFVIFFLVIIIAVIVIIFALSGTIIKPIIDLKNDVGEISGGNLDHRAVVHDNDEIGDLAESFNEMASSLKEHIEAVTKVTAEKERITAELGVATKIQADMLPTDFPKRSDIELFAAMTPAKEVGGDFYDFFFVDDEHIALVMADVSGKGVPAALFCVVAQAVLRDKVTPGRDPADVLHEVNNVLCQHNGAGLFITAWLGILDLNTGIVEYVNAGHEYPIIGVHGDSVEVIRNDNCPPLAAEENTIFTKETLNLNKGDSLFLYTDGVPEAKSSDGKRFGMDRLINILERNKNSSPEETVNDLKREVDAFQPENDPFDDVTIMSVVWKGR